MCKITYTCPTCGHTYIVTPEEYEETLSWADPHNPYNGEWLRCPNCYHAECVSDGVLVILNLFGRDVQTKLYSDEVRLYFKIGGRELVWG